MAGDVGIHEQAVVHPEDAPRAAAAASTVTETSGGVTHQYGPRVVIAALPGEAVAAVREQVAGADISADPAALTDQVTRGLDETGSLGLRAFELRQSDGYATDKQQRPLAGAVWDASEAQPPDIEEEEAPEQPAGSPTSARLIGSVAVGVIIVNGPTPDLTFSDADRTKVVAEVQNGLTWLGSQNALAGVSWVYDIRVVTLNVAANDTGTLAEKEARWRDPAMAELGYGAGLGAVQSFVDDLRSNHGTDWAYCGFFTKYPVGHFAYASLGGPRLVMAFSNDGWGPDNIDRVFAHETGHIFRAPDEYAASGCDCGGQWGHFGTPNGNCANCAPGGGVPCIMKSNDWAICSYTPDHLGFPRLWSPMGGSWPGIPAVASNADGRLEVFARGDDRQLWQIWQTAPNNGWSGWSPMGGSFRGDPVVGRNQDGRLEVFAVADDGQLYQIWQTAPNNGWSGWSPMGGSWPGIPAVASNADGRLEVFARGDDRQLWQIWQTAPNNGWSGWSPMGGSWPGNPAVASNADGRLEVFAVGDDRAMYQIWQTAPNNGWSWWSSMTGSFQRDAAVGRNQDGRLEVFVVGTDALLYQGWQRAPNNGWGSG